MPHEHGGDPEAGTNPFIGIDGTDLLIFDPSGPSPSVIPATTDFSVAMVFQLTGTFAPWFVGLPIQYNVTYTFSGRGVPDGPTLTSGPKSTVAGQLTYGDPDTTVPVPAGSLAAGLYELSAVVTFGGSPPMSAFIVYPVIEIF